MQWEKASTCSDDEPDEFGLDEPDELDASAWVVVDPPEATPRPEDPPPQAARPSMTPKAVAIAVTIGATCRGKRASRVLSFILASAALEIALVKNRRPA